MNKTQRQMLVVLVLAVLVLAYVTLDLGQYLNFEWLKEQREALRGRVDAQPLVALGAFFLLYVVVAALSLPGAAIMTLAGGALFGLARGTLVVSFASTIGATLAFLAARFLFRDSVQARFGQRLKTINAGVEREGGFYLLALRLVPIFPFFVINLLAGLTSLGTRTFYWVSQLGMLPATLVFVNAGTQLADIDQPGDILSPGLLAAFALLGLLPLITRYVLDIVRARRAFAGFERPATFDYNVLVVGAGAAGLVTSYIAAAVKAKVALIERDEMGGECLNTGCVPSKALLRTAKLLAEARDSQQLGVRRMQAEFDFGDVMDRVHRVIADIAPHDSVERYESLGVECIKGEAKVVSPWAVEVNGQTKTARAIVVATGSRPVVPPIPGLDAVDYLTSDTLWSLREQPERLVVLGGGPIGCELSQAFARLGSRVTTIDMAGQLLGREDPEVSEHLRRVLAERDGVDVVLNTRAVRVEGGGPSGVLVCERDGAEVSFAFDRLLLALGRSPNVDAAGLRELGVTITDKGSVHVDPFLRTSIPSISVCGDVAGPYQFTHVAAHQAWYASVNSLLKPFWSFRTDYSVIPWATYTDPEIARVGLSEAQARADGVAVEVTRYDIGELDRAITDGAAEGFVKVLTPPGSDKLLGATIVGPHAGELIAEFVLAMKHGLGLNKILGTIHIYPTTMEANKYVAGEWKRANAPQKALRLAERFFAWRRGRTAP